MLCSSKSRRNEKIATIMRIRTGMIVQAISIGVLWLQRAGVGLARLLNRTITMISSARTNSVIAVMIGSSIQLWKKATCSRISEAAGCRSMARSVGWPTLSAAQAWAAMLSPKTPAGTPAASRPITENFDFMSLTACFAGRRSTRDTPSSDTP